MTTTKKKTKKTTTPVPPIVMRTASDEIKDLAYGISIFLLIVFGLGATAIAWWKWVTWLVSILF